jgi:hypothetical protein
MPKKLDKLDHKYNEKLAQIRRSNVERHAGYANTLALRRNIQRAQRNTTYEMELARLRGATVQGHLAPHAHKRMADLKNMLVK